MSGKSTCMTWPDHETGCSIRMHALARLECKFRDKMTHAEGNRLISKIYKALSGSQQASVQNATSLIKQPYPQCMSAPETNLF